MINEQRLYEIVSNSIKEVLFEKSRNKYHTVLAMYTLHRGILRENERIKDHMDHLVRRYNNLKKQYQKMGCRVFKTRFFGRTFLTIVDESKAMVSFITILQNEEDKRPVLTRQCVDGIAELLASFGLNPDPFCSPYNRQGQPIHSFQPEPDGPYIPSKEEREELRHSRVFTNWDMMERAPKKWRRMGDTWEFIENNM